MTTEMSRAISSACSMSSEAARSALGLADVFRVPLGDDVRHAHGRRQQLVVRHNTVHQAELVGALRRDVLAERQELEGDLAAHDVHGVRRDGRGGEAGAQLGKAEARALGGDDEVAAQRQAAARAQGVAVHGGDDRLVDAGQ